MQHADVIVVGLGVMGAAAAWQLQRRGLRVVGFDLHAPPHDRGSSHGESRIWREAYFEDPAYVPLTQRAMELWVALEQESERTLFRRTAGLMVGPPEGAVATGARRAAEAHHLPHDWLDANALRQRWPALAPRPSWWGLVEPRAGALNPEASVEALWGAARSRGALLHPRCPVATWRAWPHGVEVDTPDGRWSASHLVLAAGPWMTELVRWAPLTLVRTRQVLAWWGCTDPGLEALPVTIAEASPGRYFYGFPAVQGEMKWAVHGEGEPCTPDAVDRHLRPGELDELHAWVAELVPALRDAPLRRHAVCQYTSTPDGHFVVDRHPEHDRVTILSPCSGHGFKFAPAVGELCADLVAGGAPPALFALARFGAQPG